MLLNFAGITCIFPSLLGNPRKAAFALDPQHRQQNFPMSDSAFWRFSLKFYAMPGVGAACIELQDRCGVDVNVLLFLLFLADQNRVISAEDAARIDAQARPWREGVVVPLRAARRSLRTPIGAFDRDAAETLRGNVKRIELEAERIQQETLEQTNSPSAAGNPASSRAGAARTNLAAFAAHLGGLPEELLAPLLQAFDAARL